MKSLYSLLLLYVLVGCAMAQTVQYDPKCWHGDTYICVTEPSIPAVPQCPADMRPCWIGDPPQTWQSPPPGSHCILHQEVGGNWTLGDCTNGAPGDLVPAPAPEPFDVPATTKTEYYQPDPGCGTKDECYTEIHIPTCADPRRTLLTSENGEKHCYLFQVLVK